MASLIFEGAQVPNQTPVSQAASCAHPGLTHLWRCVCGLPRWGAPSPAALARMLTDCRGTDHVPQNALSPPVISQGAGCNQPKIGPQRAKRRPAKPRKITGGVMCVQQSRGHCFACSVASLNQFPGHQLPGCHSLHHGTLADCLLGQDKPSAQFAGHAPFPHNPSP